MFIFYKLQWIFPSFVEIIQKIFVTSTNRQTVFANTLSSFITLQPFSLILNIKWTCKRMSPKFYKITQLLKLTISFSNVFITRISTWDRLCVNYIHFFEMFICYSRKKNASKRDLTSPFFLNYKQLILFILNSK